MAVKYDTLSKRIKEHIDKSEHFSVVQGNVVLDGKFCAAEKIVDHLVHEGVIKIDELVRLLQ